ncbi:MAG: TRAP transporter substrate-binding protein DctP [Desulfatiglandaceae bacterium]
MKKSMMLLGFVCLLIIPLSVWADGNSRPQFLIKFATVAPEGSTWMKQMKMLDTQIRERSNGRLGFKFYAGGIAGDEVDVLRRMRIGQIHCAAFSGVGFGQILPRLRVLDLPFLFRNDEETDRVHRELRPFFAKELKQKGFVLLSWAEVGDVHLFSKAPIRQVGDLDGLKVWTWSGDPIAKETFTAMGVNPIPLAITDVTTALNTGMIDTVYAPPLGALALQWQRYVRYMMALPLVHSTGALLISSRYFHKLPEDLARILTDNAEQAMAGLTAQLREQNQEALQVLQDSGVTITPAPEGKALKRFHEIGAQVAVKLAGKMYPEELLDRLYTVLKREPRAQ